MTGAYEWGDRPWARDNAHHLPCPYCGEMSLLLHHQDISDDDRRISFFCHNPGCDANHLEVILMDPHMPGDRADVQALELIDHADSPADDADEPIILDSFSNALPPFGASQEDVLNRRRKQVHILVVLDYS